MKTKLIIAAVVAMFSIGAILPSIIIAQEQPTTTPPTAPGITASQKPAPKLSVDVACMQTAVEKRDNAINAAWNTLSSAISSAVQTRTGAIKAAWAVSDSQQRAQAIRKAWSDFRVAHKTASNAFKKSRKQAWNQFRIDGKACRATATYESEGNDIQF